MADADNAATGEANAGDAHAGTAGEDTLDALSSHELHDLAVRRALHHLDVGFLWRLLKEIPAGEAAIGHEEAATHDATQLSALIADAIDTGEGDLADSLRPLYLSYLRKHRSDRPVT